jgi:hypothetical protein
MSEFLVLGAIHSFDQGEKPFGYMLVRRGKIAILSREPLPYSGPILDFAGQTIVPAFIDSHVHILEHGLAFVFPDFTPADSLAGVFDLVSAARERAAEFGFLLGFNLEPDNLREKRMPLRKELDAVIRDRPVLLYRVDGHSASLNSKGLERVSTGSFPSDGLELGSSQEPTGVLAARAYEAASRSFKALIPRELKLLAFERSCQDAVNKGVLAIGALTGSDDPGDDAPELLAEHLSQLPVRVAVFPQTRSIARARKLGLGRIGGCILIDGSFGSRSAALLEDYSDAPGNRGRLYLTDDELAVFLRAADHAGLQTAVHAIGDRAVKQVLDCYESFLTGNSLRHRIEHAELLDQDLIDRIARLGLLLGVQPAFEHYWGGAGRMYERRLGPRYRRTNPYRELLDRKVVLAGGSDAPITPIDPLLGIRTAASHPVAGHSIGLLEACRLFTDRAAFSLGLEQSKGSLTPGHDADFLVLSDSPLRGREFRVIKAFRAGEEIAA